MDSQNKECLKRTEIELFILKRNNAQIERHLAKCERCRAIYSELRAFYNLLNYQLQKPVANSVLQLTADIEKDNVLIAAILLKPQLLDEMPGERHFTSELILSTFAAEIPILRQLDNISLGHDEVIIRAIQSTKNHHTTLFLYAENKKLYSEVILKIPETDEIFKSDKKGKIEVGARDINEFDNREIMIVTHV